MVDADYYDDDIDDEQAYNEMFVDDVFRYIAYNSYSYDDMIKRQREGILPEFTKKEAVSIVMKKLLPETELYEARVKESDSSKASDILKREVRMLINIILFMGVEAYPECE
jgi:hypothetical protein